MMEVPVYLNLIEMKVEVADMNTRTMEEVLIHVQQVAANKFGVPSKVCSVINLSLKYHSILLSHSTSSQTLQNYQ